MKRTQEEDRGPGARKTPLEKRLNTNADLAKRNFSPEGRSEDADREAEIRPGASGTPRGHKGQLAQPHRSGRPSGGNIRTRDEPRR